ncbi:MAG: Fe-S cluster assembly ATPase SufC [Puniceicoccales bacterium]|jgi:Fe-S cluster assembly ATP-binding protein|nr:Fe-S cluster assembly ATPase SufC [Puniceicoccales bacterium]
MGMLAVKNLKLSIDKKIVVDGLSLEISTGEVHAIIGKNGAGKSSLAKAIAGHPDYEVVSGDITVDGESVIGKQPDEIARMGFFLAFQNPVEIPGVTVANFIRAALQAKEHGTTSFNAIDFYKKLYEKMDVLGMEKSFSSRSLNDGFSGGERKRCEILQMLMLEPKYVVFDETDSGLDIDALKMVSAAINSMRNRNFAAMVITHHNKLLEYVHPDFVHVISDGKIIKSGGFEIIRNLEKFGYQFFDAGGQ